MQQLSSTRRHSLSSILLATAILIAVGVGLTFAFAAPGSLPMLKKKERQLIAVMIDNSLGARPFQEGLEKALLVEEMTVEGGITRFAALFDVADLPPGGTGPIRSLRPYFLEGVVPYSAVILHAGGSPEAYDAAAKTDGLTAIDLLNRTYASHLKRRQDVPAPHNVFLSGEEIAVLVPATAKKTMWPPYDIGSLPATATGAQRITVRYGSRRHDLVFTYDAMAKTYKRTNGDVTSTTKPANILILASPITDIGELGRLTIPLAEGKGQLYQSGKTVPVLWRKNGSASPFRILTQDGSAAAFRKGQTWMVVVPTLAQVTSDATIPSAAKISGTR